MGIENEMLSRFNSSKHVETELGSELSTELDFFFENVMGTVVEYFKEDLIEV
ncbi:MAG: hypothetical protein MJ237_02005 [bacterium]|nr:hypothetical protein [bacterium]